MLYSRLIDALLDECIAANLGGYDVRPRREGDRRYGPLCG